MCATVTGDIKPRSADKIGSAPTESSTMSGDVECGARGLLVTNLVIHKFPGTFPSVDLFGVADEIEVERQGRKRSTVADDHKFFSRPRHSNIHSADVGQKADCRVGIASCHADIDD